MENEAAATADRALQSRASNRNNRGLSAATVIYAGCLICLAADGYLVDGSDATGLRFAGVSYEDADNTSGADDAVSIDYEVEGVHLFASASIGATDIGKPVYLLDNQTVVLSGHADLDFHQYVGRIWAIESASSIWVKIEPNVRDPNDVVVQVDIAGTNAAALTTNLNAAITAIFGDADGIYVKSVNSMEAYVIADGTSAGRKVVTTNYTLASGVITTVTNESANRLVISMRGVLKQS